MNKIYTHKNGFTLIELLVVMAIIAVLAGLSFTAVNKVIAKGNQIRDVHNAKQLALAFIVDAQDHGGVFRTSRNRSETESVGSNIDIFQGLLDDDYLTDPTVLMSTGHEPAESYEIEESNVGFQYIAGYTQWHGGRLPLLFTKGVNLSVEAMRETRFDPGESKWGEQGMAVAYLDGSSKWFAAIKEEGALTLEKPIAIAREIPDVQVCE